MDDDLRSRLFDPSDAHGLVVAHRPPGCSAVAAVVSDVVWQEVVGLLRWTAARTGTSPALDPGRWWRLAAGCADLLRRLPALSDELGEDWSRPAAPDDDGVTGLARVERTSARLVDLLRSRTAVPLSILAGEIDALGAAAIAVLADESVWTLPRRSS